MSVARIKHCLMTGVAICASLDADVEKIMSELSWSTKPRFLEYIYLKQNTSLTDGQSHPRRARSVDSSFLIAHEWNQSLFQTNKEDADNVMKMKLFRLMYESVKDSDLKIKRAELVKADYENYTGFDLGYVSGDASDKVNVMMDISKTLKRMYNVWKPVEHVNAYEQIANLAIEVTHLVDMARMIEPANPESRGPGPND